METTQTTASQNSSEAGSTFSQETGQPPKATPAHRSPPPPSHNIGFGNTTRFTHNKRYVDDGVRLLCNGEVIASNSWRLANFQIANCPRCDAFVQTSGESPETDLVLTL